MDSIEKTGGGNFILFLKCETIQNQGWRIFFFYIFVMKTPKTLLIIAPRIQIVLTNGFHHCSRREILFKMVYHKCGFDEGKVVHRRKFFYFENLIFNKACRRSRRSTY